MIKLRDTTKRACQAAISIAIAEWITYVLQLERGYWVTITAMALTMQTWGDSLKRSLERVSMTILGGCFGTVLYWVVPSNQLLILLIMLVFVFFTVYFFTIYHLIAIFNLTGFVVFLFALLGNWNLTLLCDRIVDTAIGAGIVLIVSRFFLPVKRNIADIYVAHIDQIKNALDLAFKKKQQVPSIAFSQRLYADFRALRNNASTISYELFFRQMTKQDFNLLMCEAYFCIQYVVSLIDAYHWLAPYLVSEDQKRLDLVVRVTQANLTTLKKRLKGESHQPMLPPYNLMDLFHRAIIKDSKRFASLDSEALGFFNLMYFFTKLNTRLNDIYSLLSKLK